MAPYQDDLRFLATTTADACIYRPYHQITVNAYTLSELYKNGLSK